MAWERFGAFEFDGSFRAGRPLEVEGSSASDRVRATGCDVAVHDRAGDDRLAGFTVFDADEGAPYPVDCRGGGHGSFHIDGGAGDDALTGGIGRDVLIGGRGHDTADGHAGRDRCSAEGTTHCEN